MPSIIFGTTRVKRLTLRVGRFGLMGILDNTNVAPKVPLMCHFGDKDQHIPVAGVKQLAEKYPQHQIFIYAADHGFNCDQRGSYNAAAAKQARERTLAFFRQHVG